MSCFPSSCLACLILDASAPVCLRLIRQCALHSPFNCSLSSADSQKEVFLLPHLRAHLTTEYMTQAQLLIFAVSSFFFFFPSPLWTTDYWALCRSEKKRKEQKEVAVVYFGVSIVAVRLLFLFCSALTSRASALMAPGALHPRDRAGRGEYLQFSKRKRTHPCDCFNLKHSYFLPLLSRPH